MKTVIIHSVCVCVIIEHEGKNARAELIWRLLIATMKTLIHIIFMSNKFVKYTIIMSLDVEHNVET